MSEIVGALDAVRPVRLWRAKRFGPLAAHLFIGFAALLAFDFVHGGHSPVGAAFYRLGRGALDQLYHLQAPRLIALEYGIVAFILLVLYFPRLKNPWVRHLLPVLPVAIVYALIDGFFLFLGRVPHLADIHSLDELYTVRWYYGAGAVFVLALPLLVVLLLLGFVHRDYGSRRLWPTLGGRTFIVALAFAALLSPLGKGFERRVVVMTWSELFTVQSNGRLASFLYYVRRDLHNRRVLSEFSDFADLPRTLYPGVPARTPNIHVIVLESFVDPRLFEGVRYNRSPLADELKPFLPPTASGFSHIVSPVYGGGTARACFEIISGLPSLGLVEPVEFNLMREGQIKALPWRLAGEGYDTSATIATSSEYFNEPAAYASLSIGAAQFIGDGDAGIAPRPGEKELFDGDLFEHDLARLDAHRKSGRGRPLYNYVLGMFGHYPYNRNLARHPDVISNDSGNADVGRISNQFYYRTRALGRYLARLKAEDPDAIVFVTSDHIPAVKRSRIDYSLDKYANSALLLDGWRPVDIEGRHQYEIPWLIWDLLRGEGGGRRTISSAEMERLYYTALRQSIDSE